MGRIDKLISGKGKCDNLVLEKCIGIIKKIIVDGLLIINSRKNDF